MFAFPSIAYPLTRIKTSSFTLLNKRSYGFDESGPTHIYSRNRFLFFRQNLSDFGLQLIFFVDDKDVIIPPPLNGLGDFHLVIRPMFPILFLSRQDNKRNSMLFTENDCSNSCMRNHYLRGPYIFYGGLDGNKIKISCTLRSIGGITFLD